MNDIIFKLGSVNPCGISDAVFYIPKHYIRRWPTIEDDFEALMQGRYAEYDGSFELQPGCCWKILYSTRGKGKISWDYQGEIDCKVVINKATFSFPKLTNEARAFAKFASNGDFVFCVKHDGKYHIIGNKDYRATVTPNGDSGDGPGSAKGITVEVECPDTTPLPTYTGLIYTEAGVLFCNTDTFINYSDMNTNRVEHYTDKIEGGNTVRFEAIGRDGRIHIEGSGDIVMEVSVDGVNYNTVEHNVTFSEGVAEAPVQFYIGDHVRLSATTLTKVDLNYNNVKTY